MSNNILTLENLPAEEMPDFAKFRWLPEQYSMIEQYRRFTLGRIIANSFNLVNAKTSDEEHKITKQLAKLHGVLEALTVITTNPDNNYTSLQPPVGDISYA